MKKKIVFAFLFVVMVVGAVKIAKAHMPILTEGDYCWLEKGPYDLQCAPGLICHPIMGEPDGIGICQRLP